MNKQEILDYLLKKRQLTAPVSIAQRNLSIAESALNTVKKKWRGVIITIIILIIFMSFYANFLQNNYGNQINVLGQPVANPYYLQIIALKIVGYLLIALVIFLFVWKKKKIVNPASQQLDEAHHQLQEELNSPDYISGSKEFPAKFYNYADVYRLYMLISEGRASTLQEAYTLLETQHFQEDQNYLAQQTLAAAKDAAGAANMAAMAGVYTAFNSNK